MCSNWSHCECVKVSPVIGGNLPYVCPFCIKSHLLLVSELRSEISHLKARVIRLEKSCSCKSQPLVFIPAYQHLILPQIFYPTYLYLLLLHHFIAMFHYPRLQITNPTYLYILLIQVFNPTYSLFHYLPLLNPVYHFLCLHLSFYLLLFVNPSTYYLLNTQLFTPMSQHLFTHKVVTLHLSLLFLPIISFFLFYQTFYQLCLSHSSVLLLPTHIIKLNKDFLF